MAAAALALLAGWGTDRLLAVGAGLPRPYGRRVLGWAGLPRPYSRRTLNLVAVALGALALALLLGYAIVFGQPPANLVAFGVVTAITAALCVVTAARRLSRRRAIAALAMLVLADLWVMDATLVEGRSPEAVFAESGLGAYLAQRMDGEPFRVYSPSYSLPRHVAARYGLETAGGVDPLYLEAYDVFMEAASGVRRTGYTETVPPLGGEGDIATVNREARPNPVLLGLLNVRYVAAEFPMAVEGLREVTRFGSTYLYENERVLPRAFVVGQVEPVDGVLSLSKEGFDAALEWAQTHDVARAAAVEAGRPLASGEVQAEVAWVRRSPNQLVLDVTLDRAGFLVLSQVWYPGWRAEVDGQPVTLWRAYGVLSGVYLEPGGHTVSFVYWPRLTWVGVGVSGITLGVLGWAWKRKAK